VVTTESTACRERERERWPVRQEGGEERRAERRGGTDPFFSELAIKISDVSVVSLCGRNELRRIASPHNALEVQHSEEV
jgi:hypothetical protein